MQLNTITGLVQLVSEKALRLNGNTPTKNVMWELLFEHIKELDESHRILVEGSSSTEYSAEEDFQDQVVNVFCYILLVAKYNNIALERLLEEKWFISLL